MDELKKRWNEDIDQVVSLATLMVALFVWYGEISEEWKNSLPKRLTVYFEYIKQDGTSIVVMKCLQAHLSDIGDIRALGQQIGRQMCDNKDFDFRAPFVKQDEGEPLYNTETGHFLHYNVTFTLTKLPHGIDPEKCKKWEAPFGMDAPDLSVKNRNEC